MGKAIGILITFIILAIAILMIYDARRLASSLFNQGETNQATKTLKIVGCIIVVITLGVMYLILRNFVIAK